MRAHSYDPQCGCAHCCDDEECDEFLDDMDQRLEAMSADERKDLNRGLMAGEMSAFARILGLSP